MDVIMPQLGETVLEGVVSVWHKKPGDMVKVDEALFEVETDKVTMEIPAPASGILERILVEQGVSVKVGTTLAVIESAVTGNLSQSTPAASTAPAASATVPRQGQVAVTQVLERSTGPEPKLSPVVRRLLAEYQLDPAAIKGTARNGRITREDVLAYIAGQPDTPPPPTTKPETRPADRVPNPVRAEPLTPAIIAAGPDDKVVPMNRIRRATAAHMVRSVATSPHVLQAVEVDFSAVERCRNARGAEWKTQHGFSLTYLPFIGRAVCEAIAKFPYVNASVGKDELIVHKRVHLGIAVDLDFEGLVVPVVRDAHFKNLRGLAAEIYALASRAREGALKPDELASATYTISNSGPFGTLITAPIISQPQVAILSTDGVRKKPVVIEGAEGDAIAIHPVGVIAQTFDHRAFDGAYSAAFLRELKQIVEARDWLHEID